MCSRCVDLSRCFVCLKLCPGNSSWGISSIFGSNDLRATNGKEQVVNRGFSDPTPGLESNFASIYLREVGGLCLSSEGHHSCLFRSNLNLSL